MPSRASLITVATSLVLLLVLPLWWATLAVHRAPLDYAQMDVYDRDVDQLVRATVPIYLNASTAKLPDVVPATQLMIDRALADRGVENWGVAVHAGASPDALTINVKMTADEKYFFLSDSGRAIGIAYDYELLTEGRLPEVVCDLVLNQVFAAELAWFAGQRELPNHVLRYAPRYHLTFSLFSGDGEAVTWDLGPGLRRFGALRRALAHGVANTTVDTQIEFFAETGSRPTFDEESGQWILGEDDLATFVNFAEWSLASSLDYPTLNFVLYVPPAAQSPLRIEKSDSNSFLVPQWGGVVIVNDLDPGTRHLTAEQLFPVLDTFASQLLSLLGAPDEPRSPQLRIDSLSRISAARAIRATAASLGSLKRLAANMPNIPLPQQVSDNCRAAIAELAHSLQLFAEGSCGPAIGLAGRALGHAEAAFFDKRMISQNFFPDEHKLAIYAPLLGPMLVILLSGWLRLRLNGSYTPEQRRELEQARVAAAAHKKEAFI